MGIESNLRKEGIKVTEELDKIKVNTIAKNVAQKIVAAFPELEFKLGEVFIKLSQLKMYYAEVPKGFSEANYFYKNTSIYFNQEVPIEKIENYAIHECIHYLQERKDKAGFLLRLGLCDLTQYKVHGLALNEAAVQYATAKATKEPKDNVKYYGISFDTISPTCYPLICNLIAQMAYVTGEKVLFDSTFNSNNIFKETFIEKTSEDTFYTLEKNFDKILKLEEDLLKLNNKMELSDNLNSGLSQLANSNAISGCANVPMLYLPPFAIIPILFVLFIHWVGDIAKEFFPYSVLIWSNSTKLKLVLCNCSQRPI